MSFKVGDRVAVYGSGAARRMGVVEEVQTVYLFVRFQDTSAHAFHSKQCRRLVKKRRRRVWITFKPSGTVDETSILPMGPPHFREFIEVKKK